MWMPLIINVKVNSHNTRGGGIYQRDEFYSLCDQLGIMIWQEFMFADGLYPRDKVYMCYFKYQATDCCCCC